MADFLYWLLMLAQQALFWALFWFRALTEYAPTALPLASLINKVEEQSALIQQFV